MKLLFFSGVAILLVLAASLALSMYQAAAGRPGAPVAALGQASGIIAGEVAPSDLPLLPDVPTDKDAIGQAISNLLKQN